MSCYRPKDERTLTIGPIAQAHGDSKRAASENRLKFHVVAAAASMLPTPRAESNTTGTCRPRHHRQANSRGMRALTTSERTTDQKSRILACTAAVSIPTTL